MNKELFEIEEELLLYGGFIKVPKKIRLLVEDVWEESKRKTAEYKQRAKIKYKYRQNMHNNQWE